MKQYIKYGSKERGIALPIIMVILVLAALVTLYTANTSIKEQQVTADQYRSEQAFAAAQAGVEHALKRHNLFDDDPTIILTPALVTSSAGFPLGSYEAQFCDIWDDSGNEANSAKLMVDFLADTDGCTNLLMNESDGSGFQGDKRVGILSIGRPDDNSGRRTVSVVSAPGILLSSGGPPAIPLTARGPTGIGGGNISLLNRYNNSTVWTGENLDMSSAATSTYINDGSLDPDVAANRGGLIANPGATPSCTPTLVNAMLASCNKVGNNSDILDNDANLKNIAPPDMFERIFSSPMGVIRQMAEDTGKFYTDDAKFQGETGLIWLAASDGDDVDINIGLLDVANNYVNDAPAFLVIEVAGGGTVKINGGNAFGMIFLFGDVEFVGNPVIIGSMIVTGQVKSHGKPWIIYDDVGLSLNPEGLAGMRGIEPGTWKDWGYVN